MTAHSETPASQSDFMLRFPQIERTISARPGDTLYQSARRSGVRIVGSCGGRGVCGTCVVQVIEGEIGLAHEGVDAAFEDSGKSRKKWLRACQIVPKTDCVLELAPRSLAPVAKSDVESGRGEVLPLDPAVACFDVTIEEATLEDPVADVERMARALPVPVETIDFAAARALPRVLREQHWFIQARMRGTELIGVTRTGSRALGLAVDLGTTNVAAFLIDLSNGARVASLAIENPQTAWGGDVISRINAAIREPETADELRDAAILALNSLAHDLCRAVGASPSDIVDAVVCGNTAMHHLLLGLPVRQLGRAPFVAAIGDSMDVKARELGLEICPGAIVHLPPNIGGFVGGDHVTALLGTEHRWAEGGISLVMDIGTNTEISLIHPGGHLSASCPSGPALEGGHISSGMRAAEGAIERISLVEGRLRVETIGRKAPIGLCGSGVLDAAATLLRAGILDKGGRLSAGHPDVVRRADGQLAAVLAAEVYFTQSDVRAVQLAKAAIRTGAELLLHEAGLTERDIDRFIIAGALGAYIDVKSGIAAGLFPDLPLERFEQVGNAAGLGVRQMLASKAARVRARELATTFRYVELSSQSSFQKHFLRNIGFPAKALIGSNA